VYFQGIRIWTGVWVFMAYGSYMRKKELIRSNGYNQTETTQKIGVFDSMLSSVLLAWEREKRFLIKWK
jgi:hypothetical protein